VSGERPALNKVSPSKYYPFSAQSLCDYELEQQEFLGLVRFNLHAEARKHSNVSPLIIGTVPGGNFKIRDRREFTKMALESPHEFDALRRFYELQEMMGAYKAKHNSSMAMHMRSLERITAERDALYLALDADAEPGYVPLDEVFSSPGTRSIPDVLVQDKSTRATGPPAMDISSEPSSAATEIRAKIAKLEVEKADILCQNSASEADLKIELGKLKASSRFMMLKDDYLADTDLIDQIYKESMMVVFSTLSSELGVREFSKLAAAADAVHDVPSDQASKMWGWIVRSSSRVDQAYFNARFKDRNPLDYDPSPGLPLTTAFAELAAREQYFEQMGNTLTSCTKLALRMRLVPDGAQTGLILQVFGELQTNAIDTDTLRAFERQLANLAGLKAVCFRTQAQSALPQPAQQRGAPQGKQPAAARLAQQACSPADGAQSPPSVLPPAHAPRPQEAHLRSQRPRSPAAPDARRAATQGDLCRKHSGQHLYVDCPDYREQRFNSNGNKTVSFGGDQLKRGLEARSSKAFAMTDATPNGNSFAILDGLDDDVPVRNLGANIRVITAELPLTIESVLSAKMGAKGADKLNGTFACADSGASLHIVDEQLITEDRKSFKNGTVVWGDGSTIKTVVSGTVAATLVGKDGTEQKIRFPAWGVQRLQTPLLSATAFAQGGAALHVEKGNTYLDFRKLGGKRLSIPDDCMVRFNLTGGKQSISAKANMASSKPNRRRSTSRRARRRVSAPGN
jgi:hypothetical protein